jgi:hypothetical protein
VLIRVYPQSDQDAAVARGKVVVLADHAPHRLVVQRLQLTDDQGRGHHGSNDPGPDRRHCRDESRIVDDLAQRHQ